MSDVVGLYFFAGRAWSIRACSASAVNFLKGVLARRIFFRVDFAKELQMIENSVIRALGNWANRSAPRSLASRGRCGDGYQQVINKNLWVLPEFPDVREVLQRYSHRVIARFVRAASVSLPMSFVGTGLSATGDVMMPIAGATLISRHPKCRRQAYLRRHRLDGDRSGAD